MSYARDKYQLNKPIKAEADGNCAFNAILLALIRHWDAIEARLLKQQKDPNVEFKAFIELAIPCLWPRKQDQIGKSWTDIRNAMLELAQHNPKLLQQLLSPAIRLLAIGLIRANKQEHEIGTAAAIQVEFSRYADLRLNQHKSKAKIGEDLSLRLSIGDIFICHPFILEKFEQLIHDCKDMGSATKALVNWWIKEGGHEEFLEQMSYAAHSGFDTAKYAGELEMDPVLKFFGVSADIVKEGFIVAKIGYQPGLPEGKFPLDHLANRGIIESKKNPIFRDITEAQLVERLKGIPFHQQVLSYLEKNYQTSEFKKNDKNEIIVSQNFLRFIPADCKDYLLDRHVIALCKQTDSPFKKPQYKWLFIHPKEVETRISETPDSEAIKLIWMQTNANRVTVGFVNTGAHWNVVPAIDEKPSVRRKSSRHKSKPSLFKKARVPRMEKDEKFDSNSFNF